MVKNKDEVDMDYLHYLRATHAAKRRKERRLMKELKQLWSDKNRITQKIKDIEKKEKIDEKGGKGKNDETKE